MLEQLYDALLSHYVKISGVQEETGLHDPALLLYIYYFCHILTQKRNDI